ncbi:MAG: peroxiredoxin [Phycisphaerales bacterium]
MPRALRENDPAPDFERPDQTGTPFRLSSRRGRWVVLFFYPKNHTTGCTAQACAFRDAYEDFAAAGAEVIGVSTGNPEEHAGFARAQRLPFRLIADDGSIRAAFGVPSTLWLIPGRVTYVIDPAGVVRLVFNSQLKFAQHAKRAIEFIRGAASPPTVARSP